MFYGGFVCSHRYSTRWWLSCVIWYHIVLVLTWELLMVVRSFARLPFSVAVATAAAIAQIWRTMISSQNWNLDYGWCALVLPPFGSRERTLNIPSPLTDVEVRGGGSGIRECSEICIHPSMATMMLVYHFVPFPWLFTLRLSFLSVCLSVYPKTHVPLHAMLCCSSLRPFLFLLFPLSNRRKRGST